MKQFRDSNLWVDNDGIIYRKNKLANIFNHSVGYDVVKVFSTTLLAHRVIAETLIENKENKPEVNHKDGNKKNNHPSNLEWVTRSENNLHAYSTGLLTPYDRRGDKNPNYKGGITL